MKTEKEVQVLTEKEMDNIVNFYYKEERKELKKICNQILHSIWNDIPNFYRDDFESLAGYLILFCVKSYDPSTGPFRAYASEFINTDLINAIGTPMGSDIDRIAAQTLMAVCNKTDFSDKAIQEFITADEYTEDNIEDADLYLDEVNEWSLELPAGTALFKAKYVPAMVGFVKYTYDNDTNTDALNWFKDYAFQCTKPENDIQKLLNDMKEDLSLY